MDDLAAFSCMLRALQPWLPHLVVVGGWAHRLHRFHSLARRPAHLPLLTRDADLAFDTAAALAGSMSAALEKAGFREELLGDDAPPAAHYHLEGADAGFYVEFLTPLTGSGLRRSGKVDATLSRAGITAQKLRHLDVLLVAPWTVEVGPRVGVLVARSLDLLVPNPTSFIVQKLLIHAIRRPDKRAHDLLYIHDTLELFGASLDPLRALWEERVRPALPPRTARKAVWVAAQLFREVTDTTREAARIPRDRHPAPEHLRAACHYGLEAVLGPLI